MYHQTTRTTTLHAPPHYTHHHTTRTTTLHAPPRYTHHHATRTTTLHAPPHYTHHHTTNVFHNRYCYVIIIRFDSFFLFSVLLLTSLRHDIGAAIIIIARAAQFIKAVNTLVVATATVAVATKLLVRSNKQQVGAMSVVALETRSHWTLLVLCLQLLQTLTTQSALHLEMRCTIIT